MSRLLNRVVAIIGWALLAYGATRVAADPGSFASVETARAFAIPLLLMLSFLPFVYALAVYANLDNIRAELRWILGEDIVLYRYARRRVLLTTGLRLRSVLRAARAPWHLSRPSSRVEIDRVIAHIKARTSNALAMSFPTEARLYSLVSDQDPGWEYLLFTARLEAGRTALASSASSVDVTGRAFATPRSRRKAIERLQRDNRDPLALVEDIDRLFDQNATLHAFGAPGEPGSVEPIFSLAEALILKRDSFLNWTSRAQTTGASDYLAALLAAHAELLDQRNRQIEKYIDDWIDLGERLPDRDGHDHQRRRPGTRPVDTRGRTPQSGSLNFAMPDQPPARSRRLYTTSRQSFATDTRRGCGPRDADGRRPRHAPSSS